MQILFLQAVHIFQTRKLKEQSYAQLVLLRDADRLLDREPHSVVILSHFRWMPIPVAARSKA
jgi:hypothetical protein